MSDPIPLFCPRAFSTFDGAHGHVRKIHILRSARDEHIYVCSSALGRFCLSLMPAGSIPLLPSCAQDSRRTFKVARFFLGAPTSVRSAHHLRRAGPTRQTRRKTIHRRLVASIPDWQIALAAIAEMPAASTLAHFCALNVALSDGPSAPSAPGKSISFRDRRRAAGQTDSRPLTLLSRRSAFRSFVRSGLCQYPLHNANSVVASRIFREGGGGSLATRTACSKRPLLRACLR